MVRNDITHDARDYAAAGNLFQTGTTFSKQFPVEHELLNLKKINQEVSMLDTAMSFCEQPVLTKFLKTNTQNLFLTTESKFKPRKDHLMSTLRAIQTQQRAFADLSVDNKSSGHTCPFVTPRPKNEFHLDPYETSFEHNKQI